MPRTDPSALRALLGPRAWLCHRALTGEPGVLLPPLIDHHVHLHLIEESLLAAHGIGAVLDLGGDPSELVRRPKSSIPRAAYAGAFLTAPGGYPSGRAWAPPAMVREVSDASTHPGVRGGAATAVDEQATFGAGVIKVTLNTNAGPVLDDVTLAAIISAARAHALPVVAHVEGEGMARRAISAGAHALAHTPWTERLDRSLVRRAASSGLAWISTLDIHRDDPFSLATATANLGAFAAAGGRVLYGTDLGNGDLPVGVNARELAALRLAGLSAAAIIAAMIDPWPGAAHADADADAGIATFVAGNPPQTDDDVPAWLAGATVVPAEELIRDED